MKVNSKVKIIKILKDSETPVSGEEISREIGISRTAVWKNIKKLIDEGYTITSSSSGYLLTKEKDLLIPYEFDKDSDLYLYKESTESTMDLARDLILSGKAKNGSVVVTEYQTKGVAKFNKVFSSPKGGLYFTMTILEDIPIMNINLYLMAALVSVKETLFDELNIDAESRWPLETWYQGKKISGILPEYKVENNKVKWLNIGIGINLDRDIPRRELLIKIKERIFNYIKSLDEVFTYYCKCLNLSGAKFKFITENQIIIGSVLSIDKLGTLTIETEDGTEFVYMGNSTQEEII